MNPLTKRATLLAALVAGLSLAGCGSSASTSTAGSPPATRAATVVQVASSSIGSYLADASGHALYFFALDTPGHSRCTGSCLTYWPIEPAMAQRASAPAGVSGTLGELTRPDGSTQLTVDGLPVYTYVRDSGPGMTTGQGVDASGGRWWLVAPSGQPLMSAGGSPSASAAGHGY
jgi:predicted lipoprotein with Yx(FWY)xxD motif